MQVLDEHHQVLNRTEGNISPFQMWKDPQTNSIAVPLQIEINLSDLSVSGPQECGIVTATASSEIDVLYAKGVSQ
jgi:hypothetical protein